MFHDKTPMPFGRYKDTPLIDVPLEYMNWIYKQCREKHSTKRTFNQKYLMKYIEQNILKE